MPSRLRLPPQETRSPVFDQQQGFSGGLNVTADPAFLLPNQARAMTNYRQNYAAAVKRLGTQRTSASGIASHITHGIYWPAYAEFAYLSNAGVVYQGDLTSFTAITGSATVDSTAGICAFVGTAQAPTIYIADGANSKLYSYDFTTWSTVWTGTAVIRRMVVYNSRLWGWDYLGSGTASVSGTLYYSNLSTATLSIGGASLAVGGSSGGQINVQTFGIAQILSCIVVGSSLMILHARGVSRLTGFGQSDTTTAPQAVSDTDSIVGPDAVAEADGVAWFASTRGLVQMTEGALSLVATPQTPDPLMSAYMTCTANGGTASFTKVVYNRQRSEVWVMVPTVGTYVYNLVLQSWSGPWTGPFLATNPVALVAPSDMYVGDQPNGYLLHADGPSFTTINKDLVTSTGTGGTAVTGTLQCHRMFGASGGMPTGSAQAKSWRLAATLATLTTGATAPTMGYSTVYGGSGSTTFTTPSTTEQTYYTAVGGAGPYIDLTITDAGTTASQVATVDVQGELMGIL